MATIELCPTPISKVEFAITMMQAGRYTEDDISESWERWDKEQRDHFEKRFNEITGKSIWDEE